MSDRLTHLLERLKACRHCEERFAATETAHEPNPVFQISGSARLCVAGQAPGIRAHDATKPFADPSGDRLRAWMGIDERTFYDPAKLAIIPMAFCFPGYDAMGSDLPPPRDCAALWREHLFACLPQIELILLVGKAAMAWHMPSVRSKRLDEIVSVGIQSAGDATVLPLPHPSWRNNAWLKKNPWFETDTLPVLRAAVSRLLA